MSPIIRFLHRAHNEFGVYIRACPVGQLTTKVYDYRKQLYARGRALSCIQELSSLQYRGSRFGSSSLLLVIALFLIQKWSCP